MLLTSAPSSNSFKPFSACKSRRISIKGKYRNNNLKNFVLCYTEEKLRHQNTSKNLKILEYITCFLFYSSFVVLLSFKAMMLCEKEFDYAKLLFFVNTTYQFDHKQK